MKPLRLASRTSLSFLEQSLEPVVRSWVCDWCLAPSDTEVNCRATNAFAPPSDVLGAVVRDADSGDLWVMASVDVWNTVLLAEFASGSPDGDVLEHLRSDAISSLLRSIATTLGMRSTSIRFGEPVTPRFVAEGPTSLIVVE